MESNATARQGATISLWHWPYIALTEVAILELLGALYMLLYLLYVVPFDSGAGFYTENLISTLSYFAFLAGSILIFLKRKIGIFVSLAGIIYLISMGLYSTTQFPFNRLPPPDFEDYLISFTDPFGYPSLGISVALLIIGWKKVRWTTLPTQVEIATKTLEGGEEYSSAYRRSKSRWRPIRILVFSTIPIVSVLLLYFIFVSEIRAALRSLL